MKKGFTLIELLSVIIILGVILAIAVPQVLNVIDNTRKQAIDSEATLISKAITNSLSEDVKISDITKDTLNNFIGVDATKYDSFGVDLVNNEVVVTIQKGDYIGENKIDSEVYGVEFSNSTLGVRTDDAVSKTFTVNASTIDSDFDSAEIYSEIEEVTEDGNVFVKIPKFWIKKEKSEGNNWVYKISRTKQDEDYYLPYSFNQNGKILPYILIGKYNASISDDNTKLESKSGKIPLSIKTMTEFRTLAENAGEGYQLIDIHALDVIQTLFYVEFATLDSQSIMQGYTNGQNNSLRSITRVSGNNLTISNASIYFRVGQVITIINTGIKIRSNLRITNLAGNVLTYEIVEGISGGTGTILSGHKVYNMPNINGQTNDVTTSSGSISNVDAKYSMKYRNIENIYGNMWQFVDGVNIQSFRAYVSTNSSNYETNVFDGDYKPISYINVIQEDFIAEMGYDNNNKFANFPIKTGSLYNDYYYRGTSTGVAMFGGELFSQNAGGISNFTLGAHYSSMALSYGSRIIKRPF